jgi:hypothetical protein
LPEDRRAQPRTDDAFHKSEAEEDNPRVLSIRDSTAQLKKGFFAPLSSSETAPQRSCKSTCIHNPHDRAGTFESLSEARRESTALSVSNQIFLVLKGLPPARDDRHFDTQPVSNRQGGSQADRPRQLLIDQQAGTAAVGARPPTARPGNLRTGPARDYYVAIRRNRHVARSPRRRAGAL